MSARVGRVEVQTAGGCHRRKYRTNSCRAIRPRLPELSRKVKACPGLSFGAQIRLWYNPGRESTSFTVRACSFSASRCFHRCLLRWPCRRKANRKHSAGLRFEHLRRTSSCSERFAFMVIALCEWVLCMLLPIYVFGLQFAGDPTPLIVARPLRILRCGFRNTDRRSNSQSGSGHSGRRAGRLSSGLPAFRAHFPVENIPAGLRWISNIVWGKVLHRDRSRCLLQGGGWPAMWFSVLDDRDHRFGLLRYRVAKDAANAGSA